MVSRAFFLPSRARGPPPLACAVPWGIVRKSEISLFFLTIIPIALAHYNLDASVLSLDNVYKGIQNDMETYYFLWVAVRKVLAEAPNVMLDLFKVLIVPVGKSELIVTHDILKRFSGASVRADQKTQFLKELLDGALEQFVSLPLYSLHAGASATK